MAPPVAAAARTWDPSQDGDCGTTKGEKMYLRLMKSARTLEAGRAVLSAMVSVGVSPSYSILAVYIRRMCRTSHDNIDLLTHLDRLGAEAGVPIDIDRRVFNLILSRITTLHEGLTIVARMNQAGLDLDPISCTSLIQNGCKTLDEALQVYRVMKSLNIPRDDRTLNSLMNRVIDENQAKLVLELFDEEGVQPDVVTYSALIRYSCLSLQRALQYLQIMYDRNLPPNQYTYASLLRLVRSHEDAMQILQCMRADGVPPSQPILRAFERWGVNPDTS